MRAKAKPLAAVAATTIWLLSGTSALAAEASPAAPDAVASWAAWLWLIAPVGAAVALVFAYYFYHRMMSSPEGDPEMIEIADGVRSGAYAYLKRQYTVVAIVFVVIFAIFSFLAYVLEVQNKFAPFAFLLGGSFSALAGFIGMKTATNAGHRTACGARESLNRGLQVAFRAGAVLGLTVVGLGLINIAIFYYVLQYLYNGAIVQVIGYGASAVTVEGLAAWKAAAAAAAGSPEALRYAAWEQAKMVDITTTMLTFGMGASTMALFARVGGGIFTKAADVGADLVGKIEAGIPEDDPRNPATIADNVGDNVGDVAGMGADLYESYCGSILATAAIGAGAFAVLGIEGVLAPMIIAGIGIFCSIIGIFAVRTNEGATQENLLAALGRGVNVSTVLIIAAMAAVC